LSTSSSQGDRAGLGQGPSGQNNTRRKLSITRKLGQRKVSASLLAAAAAAYASAEKPHVIEQWNPIEIPDPVLPPTHIPTYHAHPLENQKTDLKLWLRVFGLIFLCLDPLFSFLLFFGIAWLVLGLIYLNSDSSVCAPDDQNTFWLYCVTSTVFSFVSAMISRCYIQYIVSFYVSDYEGATTGDFDDMAISTESLAATVLIEFTMFVYGTTVMFDPLYTCDDMKETGLWKIVLITYWLRNLGLGVMGYTLAKRVYVSAKLKYLSPEAAKRRALLVKKRGKVPIGMRIMDTVSRATSSKSLNVGPNTDAGRGQWFSGGSGHSIMTRLNRDTYNPLNARADVDPELGLMPTDEAQSKKRRSSLKDKVRYNFFIQSGSSKRYFFSILLRRVRPFLFPPL